jgi:hypothetical protein
MSPLSTDNWLFNSPRTAITKTILGPLSRPSLPLAQPAELYISNSSELATQLHQPPPLRNAAQLRRIAAFAHPLDLLLSSIRGTSLFIIRQHHLNPSYPSPPPRIEHPNRPIIVPTPSKIHSPYILLLF